MARRIYEARKGRVRGLSHAFYETHPAYRAEFLEKLIVEARGSSELRRLITRREFLRSWWRYEETGRLHVAHVLDHYCQEVYGLRSYEVLDPTNAIQLSDILFFPAEYFGPDAQSVYGDGALKKRPCPWETWKKERQSASTNIKGNWKGTLTGDTGNEPVENEHHHEVRPLWPVRMTGLETGAHALLVML